MPSPIAVSRINQYVTGATLPTLTYAELLQLYDAAQLIEFNNLRIACATALVDQVSSENVLQLMGLGVDRTHEPLIHTCCKCINDAEDSINLYWDHIVGLTVKLSDLNEQTENILNAISPNISILAIDTPAVRENLLKKPKKST